MILDLDKSPEDREIVNKVLEIVEVIELSIEGKLSLCAAAMCVVAGSHQCSAVAFKEWLVEVGNKYEKYFNKIVAKENDH